MQVGIKQTAMAPVKRNKFFLTYPLLIQYFVKWAGIFGIMHNTMAGARGVSVDGFLGKMEKKKF